MKRGFAAGQVGDAARRIAQAAERGPGDGGGPGTALGLLGPALDQGAAAPAHGRPAQVDPGARVSVQLLRETVRHVLEPQDAS